MPLTVVLLLLLLDGKEESVTKAKAEILPVAEKEFNPDQDNQDVMFYFTGEVCSASQCLVSLPVPSTPAVAQET